MKALLAIAMYMLFLWSGNCIAKSLKKINLELSKGINSKKTAKCKFS